MYAYHLQSLPTNCHENTGYPQNADPIFHQLSPKTLGSFNENMSTFHLGFATFSGNLRSESSSKKFDSWTFSLDFCRILIKDGDLYNIDNQCSLNNCLNWDVWINLNDIIILNICWINSANHIELYYFNRLNSLHLGKIPPKTTQGWGYLPVMVTLNMFAPTKICWIGPAQDAIVTRTGLLHV